MKYVALAWVAGCATTSSVCPPATHLVADDNAGGRVESCVTTTGGVAALPAPNRQYPGELAIARPSTNAGVRGPYTHWYPDGAIESTGTYDANAQPDGTWAAWNPDGSRKLLVHFAHGVPVGCVAQWDAHGTRTTATLDGDQLHDGTCTPPADTPMVIAERRSHPRASRPVWGDVSLDALAQGGAFGARNSTQLEPDPTARAAARLAVRNAVGAFRFGGGLGYRMASSDDSAGYLASAVAAYVVRTPVPRLSAELEAQVGVEYIDITARRMDQIGTGHLSLVAPLGGARATAVFGVTPAFAVTLGVGIEYALPRDSDQMVTYCAPPFCGQAQETWKLGGASYGIDLGLRLIIK